MSKSYGLEYFVIVAAVAASLSVPVFASSIVSMTVADNETMTASPPSTVRSLGTIRADELKNQQSIQPGMETGQDANDQSLQPHEVNGIQYVTGGIGDEERAALDTMKHDFNLHITSAGVHGEFVGNTHILISDTKGNELLNAPAGPIFYAKLPAGTYMIEAHSGGQQQVRRVNVGTNKPLFFHFAWQ